MSDSDKKERIILLGHIEGGLSVMMDLLNEMSGFEIFDVVKNIDTPDCLFPQNIYQVKHFPDSQYDFGASKTTGVQFGVHHANVKYVLYHHFLKNYDIQKGRYLDVTHRSNYVAQSAVLGQGFFLEPMVVVSSCAKFGFGVSVKRSASIGHHADLGDFATINPGVILSGHVTVGMGTEVGSGTVVSNNVSIGERTLIGAGSVVTRDIPDGVIAYGNPCKVIRPNERWTKISTY